MSFSYQQIFEYCQKIIKKYDTRNPKEILKQRQVKIIAFSKDTKLLGMFKVIKRNSFVFYNPYVNKNIQDIVLAHELGHEIYHKDMAKDSQLIESSLFDITSQLEIEANIFAAHLLIDENKLLSDIEYGYNYEQLASIYNVHTSLMIFKLNEMQRLGLIQRRIENIKADFLKDIGWQSKYYDR